MRFTKEQYEAYLMRTAKQQNAELCGRFVSAESVLHDQIIDECKRRGWVAFHGSMAHKTFRTPGEPDFVILAERGRTFMVECKKAKAKLSPDQLAIHHWANKLGHHIHTIRSFQEFIDLCG